MAPSENSTAGDVVVLVDPCWSPSSSLDERLGVLPVAVHTQATVLAILRDPQIDGGSPRLSTHGLRQRQRLYGYGTWWSSSSTSERSAMFTVLQAIAGQSCGSGQGRVPVDIKQKHVMYHF